MEATIRHSPLVLAAMVAAWSGCEAPLSQEAEQVQSAVLGGLDSANRGPYLVKQYNDCKGNVESAIWMCFAQGPAQFHQVTCKVGDSSYVAVGGGAEVVGWNDSLSKSYLVDAQLPFGFGYNFDSFRATSKAHPDAHEHSLYTFVIGLRVRNITRAQMIGNLQVHRTTTGPSLEPEIWGQVAGDRVLLSTGLNLLWTPGSGLGQLLAGSWAGADGGWGVSTRSVERLFSSRLDAYALTLPRNLLGVRLRAIGDEAAATVERGDGGAMVTASRSALTHIGGWAYGDRRALRRVSPDLQDSRRMVAASSSPGGPFIAAPGATFAGTLGLAEVFSGPQDFCVPRL